MPGFTVLIFGASGDLAKRKLIPALYALYRRGVFKHCLFIGCAITDTTEDAILNEVKQYISECDETLWQEFAALFYYKAGIHFDKKTDMQAFKNYVEHLEQEYNLGNSRLLYLAIPSDYFCTITHLIGETELAQRSNQLEKGWHRMVYEKPFGKDLASAHEINECIAQYFDEEQIYRIDHYLTKELAGNIALLRFTNIVLEPLWDHRYISNVQIIADEQDTITGRAAYYDQYGVLRDMVQNHIMQLMALVAMESPEKLLAEPIRNERARVLQHVQFVDGILGQYKGYQQELGVPKNSKTETWSALMVTIDSPRFAGVPFYIRTGKAMPKKETVIHIVFKTVDCLLMYGCPVPANYLTIRIDPDAGFTLHLNAKKPGALHEIIPVAMDFCHSCLYAQATPKPYEVILEEVVRGTQSVVVRFDEIEYAWHVIDEIKARSLPLYTYDQGTSGPKEFEEFNKKHGIRWRS